MPISTLVRSDRRLRILRVITRMNVGGPALHVVTLTARLDPERFESLVAIGAASPKEGDMLDLRPDLAEAVQARLHRVPALRRNLTVISDLSALGELRRLIRRFRPHVVETHMAKAGTLGRLAAALEGVPAVIHTFHGTSFRGHFPTPIGGLFASWERLLAAKTDALIAVSPAVARDLEARRIGSGRIRVVPLGLDLSPFLAVPPLVDRPEPVVTLVARLVPVKDIPLFVDAVTILRNTHPGLGARIVGDGPLRVRLRARSPSWIQWLGNRADLPALFTDSAVIALTSRSEGLPVSLIEALAAGRPAVGVPVGGIVDLLTDRPGAILTTDRSPPTVADALRRALEEPEIRLDAERGRQSMAEEFGVDRLIATMSELYEELCARAGE